MTATPITMFERAAIEHEPTATRSKRPVVVHLLHTVAYGGIETILINWFGSVDPARVDLHLVVFANPSASEDAFVREAAKRGIKVRKIPWSRRKPIFKSARALAPILRELNADIVHAHNVYAEVVAYIAARKTGAKVMNTLYVWADFGWKRNIQQWISARLIRRFDLVTSQCPQTMNETIRRGVPASRQKVLISGIRPLGDRMDPQTRRARRAEMGMHDDDFVLVNVARLYPEKAQDLLLRAFKRIHEQRPQTQLRIYGIGPLNAELRALCTSLGLDDCVRFMGFAEDLPSILQCCDMMIHPSHAEGVPLSICEGMRAGLPILATRVGGVPDMITDDRSGCLIPPNDESNLAETAVALIDDETTRKRLGEGARRFIEEEYSLEVAADGLMRTYEELAAR
ncbi:MAG: glycosyltransferase family 4 protein [Phycisphaerales bacterium]|nr:glycosyltransferase family 4 protein [Phycisphaerales bacterium]